MTRSRDAHAGIRAYAVAACVGVALVLVVFRAVLWHPDSTVLLRPADATSAARDYWAMAEQHRSPFTFVRDAYLNAPEGQERAPAVQIANAVQPLFIWTLGPRVGYLAAVNLFWVVGLIASVIAMTALFWRLRLHPLAAFAGTVGFVLSQWEFEQLLYGHVAFAHLWVFPVITLALLWAAGAASSWAPALPGALTAVSFYVSSYFGLFALALASVFVGAAYFSKDRVPLQAAARRLAVGVAAFVVVLLPAGLAPLIAPSSELGLPSSPRSGLHGADLSNYLIPSAHNALYGHLLGVADSRVGDSVLFAGIALTGLALLAAWRVMRSRTESQSFLVQRFAFWLVPVALLMSMPAYLYVGSRAIPLPNAAYVIGGVVQWWRSYIRFGLLVGFALALLAGFALDALLRSGRRRLQLAAALAAAAVVLEALPFAAVPTTRITETPVSRWLAANGGGGIVAIYPMAAAPSRARRVWDDHVWSSLFLQTRHGHRLYALPAIRLRPTRTDAIRVLTSDLRRSDTARLLRGEGVRYVVSDDAVYRSLGLRPPADGQPGLDLVARLGAARIFRVVARPESAESALARRRVELARLFAHGSANVRFGTGFHYDEPYQGAQARWLRQDGVVHVRQPLARTFVTHRLTFVGFANAFPRQLEVWDGDRLLTAFRVGISETRHSVRIGLRETVTTLRLRARPGATKFGDGTIDLRRASVFVIRLSVDPVDVEFED